MNSQLTFAEHLEALLPSDLPNREACIAGSARHLELMVEVNKQYNLSRILDPREAAIKHVLDSVAPWRLFASARHIADAGSGAGFPGIPLALVFPDIQFSLLESTNKKANFIKSSATALGLRNVTVYPERVETWLNTHKPDLITARALASLRNSIPWFAPAVRKGTQVLLYKGPDVETQIADAMEPAANRAYSFSIIQTYELPDGLGSRCVVALTLAKRPK